MKVYFVTRNLHKAREVIRILSEHGIVVDHVPLQSFEIQSTRLEEIALRRAEYAKERLSSSVLVEDTGLFIRALNGFPGPYSNYVFDTIGNQGLLKLMTGEKDRSATFRSVAVYYGEAAHAFSGEVEGEITDEERGVGWGYDPIFLPRGSDDTYAEMGIRKNTLSHKRKALEKFAEFLRSESQRK